MTATELSIVIPTRGRSDRLRMTLSAVGAQTEEGFETIVVVDGTDQEAPELPGVRVLQQEQAGPGAARNLAVGATDRPLILFLNDDMVPRADLVARHLAAHRAEPATEVAVLGRVVWHPSVPRDRLHRWLDWSSALFDYAQLDPSGEHDAGWSRFYSCNVSLKRELFLSAGGFDEDFVFDYEDLDIAWRLREQGMRLTYEPAAVVEHLHVYDWDRVLRRYASRGGAERLMAAKHDWFEPWFYRQMKDAERDPAGSRAWTFAVDLIPRRAGRLRRAAERRADLHYRRQLAPIFFASWERAEEVERKQSGSAAES